MQTLAGKDPKGKDYYLAYIELHRKIIVWVDGQQKYIIELGKEGNLICSCPGNFYHNHCRHVDFATSEFDFNRTVKPTTFIRQIAEEYYSDWLKRRFGDGR